MFYGGVVTALKRPSQTYKALRRLSTSIELGARAFDRSCSCNG